MRKYHNQKVLYYSHETMLREKPLRWISYFFIMFSGIAVSAAAYTQFPDSLNIEFRNEILITVAAVPLLLGIILYVTWWLKNYSHRLLLTAKHLVVFKGILVIDTNDIALVNVQTINAKPDNLWEAIVGIGTVRIGTSSSDGYDFELCGMPNIKRIRAIVMAGKEDG